MIIQEMILAIGLNGNPPSSFTFALADFCLSSDQSLTLGIGERRSTGQPSACSSRSMGLVRAR